MEAIIQETPTRAIVTSGSTLNFIFLYEAKLLGINYVKGDGSIKSVNSKAKPVVGVALDVEAKIG